MGLFDFFKSKKEPVKPAKTTESSRTLGSDVKFEIRLTNRQMDADQATVDRIAEVIIAEDPFVKPFQGKMDADFREGERRTFEYENVTTMNVSLEPDFTLVIEGITLGKVPANKITAIKPYYQSNMATIYVYVIGGRSKQRVAGELVEYESPYGLDIYMQFN